MDNLKGYEPGDSSSQDTLTFDGTDSNWPSWNWKLKSILETYGSARGSPNDYLSAPRSKVVTERLAKAGVLPSSSSSASSSTSSSSSTSAPSASSSAGTTTSSTSTSTTLTTASASTTTTSEAVKKAAKLREEITREADRQYRICTRLLVKGLRKRAIQLVQGLPHDDPYAIYQRFVSEFDGQGRATKLSLYHKANTIRLAPGESVYILVSKLDDIFRKLSDLKERLSEDYKIGALLNALPNKPVFQTFKSAILTSDKDDWTYAQVCERLALCGEQEHRDQLQVPSDGAFASLPGGGRGGKRPSRSKQRKKPLGACPNCRKEGHWAKFCPAPCGLCSGSNHERRRCPRFARNKAHPSSSTPRSSSNSRVQEPSFKATTSWLVADSTFAVPQSDSSISYLDSGTSRHMVGEAVPLTDITPRVSSVRTAGKELLHLDKSATGHIDIVNEDGQDSSVRLTDSIVNPHLGNANLVSISKLDRLGYKTLMANQQVKIYPPDTQIHVDGKAYACGSLTRNGLYALDQPAMANYTTPKLGVGAPMKLPTKVLHRRFGHVGPKTLGQLQKLYSISPGGKSEPLCDTCAMGKAKRKPFRKAAHFERCAKSGEGWHLDLFMLRIKTLRHERYILLAFDDQSRFARCWRLQTKDQQLACFKELKAWSEAQTGLKIKLVRTDGEWRSNEWLRLKAQAGFEHNPTLTPWWNEAVALSL